MSLQAKSINDVKEVDLLPQIARMEQVWNEMRSKMASSIPLRQTVCRFTKDVKTARIATSEELEHLLFSCSLGLFMTDVELKRKNEHIANSPWVVEARFCVLIPKHGYVVLHNAYADVTSAVADMDPVMTAQTYAIKNVLRLAGFKAEEEFDDPFDASSAASQADVDVAVADVSAEIIADKNVPSDVDDGKEVLSSVPVDVVLSDSMPEQWVVPASINVESIRSLLLATQKPIDYTETLMDVIKHIRSADPVLKKMKWSHLFSVAIKHEDPPTRLSGLTTLDMELLTSLLLKFQRMGA